MRDYQAGPLGTNYYPTSGSGLYQLVNAGSRSASAAGLYHHTVRVDQAKEAAVFAHVAIGYHYMALDTSGQPQDTDKDGLADYVEDRNGNGVQDSGETSFNNADSDNDGLTDGAEVLVFHSDPLDAYSGNRHSNGRTVRKDCDFYCVAPSLESDQAYQAGDTQAQLVIAAGQVPNTLQLTLQGAPAGSLWDIYFTYTLNTGFRWTLYVRGDGSQTLFNVPNPGGVLFN